MGKPTLTEAEYVDKLNDLLVQQDWYEPGMKIVLTPKGGFPHGLDLVGESNLARLPQLRKIIDQDFVLHKP